MPTRTGYNPWHDFGGTGYAQELLRSGLYILAELTSEPVAAPTRPCTIDILRNVQVTAGSSARGIAPTTAAAAGLTNVPAVIHLPADWNEAHAAGSGVLLKETERMVALVDVPASATVGADVLLLTDRLRFLDPVYGLVEFTIHEINPFKAAGYVHARVEYAREGT